MGFSRQEYWSRLSFPSPGDLPDPGIKPSSLVSYSSCIAGSHRYFCPKLTWASFLFPAPSAISLPTHLEPTLLSFPVLDNSTQLPKSRINVYPYITFPSFPLYWYQIWLIHLLKDLSTPAPFLISILTVLIYWLIIISPNSSPLDHCNRL